MRDTVEAVTRKILAHCPLASFPLARTWVQDAHDELCEVKRWSWLRGQGEILIDDQKSGTATVTRGSATVALGTLTYAATDIGRQFRVSTAAGSVLYSIIGGAAGVSITLDAPYGGDDATLAECGILDAYYTTPEDFGSFVYVVDPVNNWTLDIWVTEAEANLYDAKRALTGTPYAVVAQRYSTANSSGVALARYEVWPYQTTRRNLPYLYQKRGPTLADADYFLGVFRTRSDVVMELALSKAAEWPGLPDKRNPYYSLELAERKRRRVFGPTPDFSAMVELLESRDEEVYMTWLLTVGNPQRIPFGPMDANYTRSHE